MSRKLHIGGLQQVEGWEILNAVPGAHVDHVCNANELSQFEGNTFAELYASHIVEHLDYIDELTNTLAEWHRVLVPGGKIFISVPDMNILAEMFLMKDKLDASERFHIMRIMFGGHSDKYDYHVVGLNDEFLSHFLLSAGFEKITRVESFDLFEDMSCLRYKGVLISLNVMAKKPMV